MQAQHDSSPSSDLVTYCVIANVRPARLERLREALSVIRPLSVTATEATVWGDGHELLYRGSTCRVDDTVVRLEIACAERHVDWIVSAITKVLTTDGVPTDKRERVIALPVRALASN